MCVPVLSFPGFCVTLLPLSLDSCIVYQLQHKWRGIGKAFEMTGAVPLMPCPAVGCPVQVVFVNAGMCKFWICSRYVVHRVGQPRLLVLVTQIKFLCEQITFIFFLSLDARNLHESIPSRMTRRKNVQQASIQASPLSMVDPLNNWNMFGLV